MENFFLKIFTIERFAHLRVVEDSPMQNSLIFLFYHLFYYSLTMQTTQVQQHSVLSQPKSTGFILTAQEQPSRAVRI